MATRQETGVPIIGVPNPNDGDDADRAEFIAGMSTQVSHVLDDPGSVWTDNEVVSQPSWIFVSANGSHELHTGGLGPQRLAERLEALASV